MKTPSSLDCQVNPLPRVAAIFLLLLLVPAQAADNRAHEIREFTGAPTKIVWVQDAGDSAAVFSERPTLKLMGFDTEDGKGERAILPDIARYWRPVITDDGMRVVFGDKDKLIVYVVNFDGTGLRPVVENALFEDVWTDPKDGTDWIYAKVKEKRADKEIEVIRRFRMDKPEVSELVWDKMPIHQFMVSGDGRSASGGGDGGNSPQGLLTLPNGTFNARAGGCWPSMAPDGSQRMWVFTGNHRSIHMCIPTNRSGNSYSYTVEFNKSPGITLKGQEELYHPRWSNNIRFLVATSPLSEWSFQSEAKIPNHVAEKVEIYLGKFTEGLDGVEKWMAVSSNSRGDYWPCAWIKPSKDAANAIAMPELPEESATAVPDKKGLIFLWENGSAGNQIDDPQTGQIRQCTGQFRGEARLGLHSVLELSGGAFLPDNAADPLLKDCKASNQFAFEAVLKPLGEPTANEKVVMAFAGDLGTGNVVITQQGDQLGLRLKTDDDAETSLPLVRLVPNQLNHLIVSYAPGKLGVYLNGKRVILPNPWTGGLSKWTPQPLILGDSAKGDHNWPGSMENIGLFSREISEAEARQRFNQYRDATAARKSAARAVVEAKLVGRTPAADPKGIAPYRRCVSVQLYEVTKVLEGKLDDPKITVAQWSVLDGEVVPDYLQMNEGQTYKLALEAWEDHPEQESERMISGDFDAELPLFYDVTSKPLPPTPPQTSEWRGFKNDPNAGGDWNATLPEIPWTTPTAPIAADAAVLGSVTKGSREIITSQPVTIRALTIDQSEKGAVNRLKPGASFTLTGEQPLTLTAGSEWDLNGQDLLFVNDSIKDVTLNGTVRLGGNGMVTAITVIDGGYGYTQSPKVSLAGGSSGAGAAAEATMSVDALPLISLGAGYTEAPTVTIAEPDIAGGRTATAVAVVDKKSGALERIAVKDKGAGYVRAPKVTISGGGGDGAEVEPTLAVSAVILTNGGKGYTQPPTVTFEGGDGQSAFAQAALQLTVLRYRSEGGHAFITNEGTVDQSGAALVYDWAAAKNNTGKRGFLNKGTWTLQKGATIQFGSSTGRDNWAGGDNTNVGTLRVLEGSSLGISRFLNQGLLELGAGAYLGHVKFALGDNQFINSEKGIVKVVNATREQPAIFGGISSEQNRKRTIFNGVPDGSSPAQIVIGDGKDASTFRVQGGEVVIWNRKGATVDIQAGARLALITNDAGSRHRFEGRSAQLNNEGNVRLAGELQVQGNHAGFTGIENYGAVTISGDQAAVDRLQASTGPGAFYKMEENSAMIRNNAGGLVQGSGTLTYLNHTESDEGRSLRLINKGILTPGTDAVPGQLTFKNVDVLIGFVSEKHPAQGGTLQIDIAGPATDPKKFDSLKLASAVDAGKFEIVPGAPSTLNVVPANGITPKGTYRIVTATGITGTFDTLQFRGQTPVPYTVNYLPDGIEVVFP